MEEDVVGPLRDLPGEKDVILCSVCERPLRRGEARVVSSEELGSLVAPPTFLELCPECDAARLRGDVTLPVDLESDEPGP
jgi:hypothetical protein